MKITKIVITGGPCAGKTTALRWVRDAFTHRGYTVLTVAETATELISGGVATWTCGSGEEYQICQLRLQLAKEQAFEYAARTMSGDKILIVCDRGTMDNKAYMDSREFHRAIDDAGLDEQRMLGGYDAVFHLVTAAKGAGEFYMTENNSARTETAKEASAIDDRLLCAWAGHRHFRVIDNSTCFEDKMERLIAEIASFLEEQG